MSSVAGDVFGPPSGDGREREQLLDVTVRHAADVGPRNISVRSLCASAGLRTRTFYRYFGDVGSAFLAASHAIHAELRSAIGEAYASAGDAPARRALASVDALVSFVREDPVRASVLFVEGPSGGVAIDAVRAETVEWAVRLVMGRAVHPRPASHPWDQPRDDSTHRLLAEIAVGGVNTLIWRQLVSGDLERLDDATPHMVDALLRPYEWARRSI